ncbi:MAG: RsmD family RNA methyltransferase [Candidatus Margulisiibacteriota bacterium]
MHILGGTLKGKSLTRSKTDAVRATQSRVREAVFNILQTRVSGSRFLDLFSGTGAMGLEAWSRGAVSVTCVDQDVRLVRQNCKDTPEIRIVQKEVVRFVTAATEPVDIIFVDPPWQDLRVLTDTLKGIVASDILFESGLLLVEHYKKTQLPTLPFTLLKTYQYGDTVLTVWTR